MVAESLAWQESDVKDTVKSNVSETHCLTIGMIVAAQCSYKQSWRLSCVCVTKRVLNFFGCSLHMCGEYIFILCTAV